MRLQDKNIIVTGSCVGIGAALARLIVAEGGRVVVHGLEKDEGQSLVDSLCDRAVLSTVDLTSPRAADQLVGAAIDAFGTIHSVVNNAALVVRSTIESTDAELFDHVIAVNLRAPLLLIRAALPQLIENEGSVLNIGSVNAYCGEPTFLAYSVSKGGLMTMTRNLADALGTRKVRVNQINPGWVLTEREDRLQREDGQPEGWFNRQPATATPSGTLIRPETLAEGCIFWLSDQSRPISGSVTEMEQFPFIGRNPPKV